MERDVVQTAMESSAARILRITEPVALIHTREDGPIYTLIPSHHRLKHRPPKLPQFVTSDDWQDSLCNSPGDIRLFVDVYCMTRLIGVCAKILKS